MEIVKHGMVFMNSALNPFIYCWRLQEIRTAVKKSDLFSAENDSKVELSS